ncbi:MAG: hypothetical protein IPM82_18630 [Saprospiraceae bacterium]|nr:hypothetical protein [Saprospiraceae bacterium]
MKLVKFHPELQSSGVATKSRCHRHRLQAPGAMSKSEQSGCWLSMATNPKTLLPCGDGPTMTGSAEKAKLPSYCLRPASGIRRFANAIVLEVDGTKYSAVDAVALCGHKVEDLALGMGFHRRRSSK